MEAAINNINHFRLHSSIEHFHRNISRKINDNVKLLTKMASLGTERDDTFPKAGKFDFAPALTIC